MRGDEVHAVVATLLRSDGQRYTPGRRALVDLLAGARHPMTIPELLEESDGLKQSSLYRNLAVLERAGAVTRVVTSDEYGRYELAEGLTGHHHHHLVCESCGTVRDVVLPGALEQQLDQALGALAARHRFVVDHHRLDLLGRCSNCR